MKKIGIMMLCLALPSLAHANERYTPGYAACMEEAGGVTVDMIDCIAEELAMQDARLNENYRALRESLSEERRQSLLQAQRLWIQYRDANCQFYATAGGTLARVSANECMLRETAERAQELDAMVGY
ncbi:lysozyme inhibitor LprI family protein [Halomonas sp. THAF12]|uniref:lysozyme inhibitor LprI family protein n=1 Tax=Halomonas sp. B23F22_10 TaxID=3459515 RepID=UPI00373E5BCA